MTDEPVAHEAAAESPVALSPEPVPAAPEAATAEPAAKPKAGKKEKAAPESAPAAETAAAPPDEPEQPVATAVEEPSKKHWYVVKVQSGREESIKDAIERRVKIEGLEEFFGQIVIPVEKVVEMRHTKEGKAQRVTRSRKLYPGYLMVEVEYNDRILYLFRETSGVGDFVGGGGTKEPPPMPSHEIQRITNPGDKGAKPVEAKVTFERGERVKVKKGPFTGMEGEIKEVLDAKDKVRIELTIFGRAVPVELEYWDIERV